MASSAAMLSSRRSRPSRRADRALASTFPYIPNFIAPPLRSRPVAPMTIRRSITLPFCPKREPLLEAFPHERREAPQGLEAHSLVEFDGVHVGGGDGQAGLARRLRPARRASAGATRNPRPVPRTAGEVQICVTWPTPSATMLVSEMPCTRPLERSSATQDAGWKNVPQPGYCTMLNRKRRAPSAERYWSLISLSMCPR